MWWFISSTCDFLPVWNLKSCKKAKWPWNGPPLTHRWLPDFRRNKKISKPSKSHQKTFRKCSLGSLSMKNIFVIFEGATLLTPPPPGGGGPFHGHFPNINFSLTPTPQHKKRFLWFAVPQKGYFSFTFNLFCKTVKNERILIKNDAPPQKKKALLDVFLLREQNMKTERILIKNDPPPQKKIVLFDVQWAVKR